MNNLQKVGGVAALINAAAYIIGFGMALTLLAPAWELDPAQFVAFLADNQALMFVWHLVIYIIAGVFMVPLVLALHERLKAGGSVLTQTATAFGIIWAGLIIASGMLLILNAEVVVDLFRQDPEQATTVWLTLSAVEDALGGGIELPGGLWILLVSWAALLIGGLPKALNFLGVIIGIAGILTVFPSLGELGTSIFGLGFIIWFIWVGIVMLAVKAQ